ncbi:MAG: tandem-95 repeat protein [Candidatus Zixiibacteriota bacterium]
MLQRFLSSVILGGLLTGVPLLRAEADPATFHLVMINELYSNADGTKQFVELISIASGQTQMQFARVNALNPSGTVTTLVHDFTSTFSWGLNDKMLLATQAVADELGFAPDFIIPDGAISITDGRVIFAQDPSSTIDALAYGDYTGSTTGFGTPAAALPSDGVLSLHRTRWSFIGQDNSQDFTIATNTPTNRAGQTGELGQVAMPPVLDPIGPQNTAEGMALNVPVSASDPNGPAPDLFAEDLPAGASFVDHNDGTGDLDWTPTFLQGGSMYDVRFIASDGDSADTEMVTITVAEVTDPPVARDTVFDPSEDVPLSKILPASDPDLDALLYTITAGPFHGGISGFDQNTGAFTYQSDLNFNGPDSLFFEVFDGAATSATALVRLPVTPVNDPPVAASNSHSTSEDTPLAIGAMPVTDVDDVAWTISHTGGPFNGSVSDFNASDGSFTYTPNLSYVGPDSVFYQANDGEAPSNVAIVRISVIQGCLCMFQADLDASGSVDATDLAIEIDIIFFGASDVQDGSCPRSRADFNADGVSDSVDLALLIDHVFFGGPGPNDPCS